MVDIPPLGLRRSVHRRLLCRLVAVGLLALGSSCDESRARATPDAPELSLDLGSAEPSVAKAVRERWDAARRAPADARAWGRLGASLEVHGYHAEAALAYAHAGTLSPDEWRWPYFEAMCRRREAPSLAAPLLARAVSLEGNHPPLRVELGDTLLELDRGGASEEFEAARAKDQNCAAAWRGLAAVALKEERLEDARAAVEQAARLAPSSRSVQRLAVEVARRRGDTETEARHRALLGAASLDSDIVDPEREALWWHEGRSLAWRSLRTRKLIDAGDLPRALSEWQIATTDDPASAPLRAERAVAEAMSGLVESALPSYEEAVRLGSDRDVLARRVAAGLTRAGKASAAVPLLEGVLGRHPDDFGTRVDLGSALALAGRPDSALTHLRAAADAQPASPPILVNLAGALDAARQPSEAARVYERLAALVPRHPEVYDRWALALMRSQQVSEAVRVCRSGREIDPDNATTANRLAWILATAPVAEERNGAEALELAGSLNTSTRFADPMLLDTLAAAQAEVGDFDAAVQTIGQAIRAAGASRNMDPGLAERMQKRLEQYYRKGRAYHGPP